MSTRAPVRLSEAGSLAKASSPEPFSTSKTSNWVARAGGLPPYVQHIAHDLKEKGKTESEAIQLAIGIVKNPPASWGAEAKAAAAKAAAEWEAKKGASKAKGAGKLGEAKRRATSISLADRSTLRSQAKARLKAIEEAFGLQMMLKLTEAATSKPAAFSPELKRTASASSEGERFEVHHEGQQVGTVASRRGYAPGGSRPVRWNAKSVNGRMVGDTEDSKSQALDSLRKHLEEGPARVSQHASGKWLVRQPESYSGGVTHAEFPSESSARYAAGLPERKTQIERESEVEAMGECVIFDLRTLMMLEEELPPGMVALAEAVEDGNDSEPDGDADDLGLAVGDRVNYLHSTVGRVKATVKKITSRHVHVHSPDPRVPDKRLTRKEAKRKLSVTTKAVKESLSEAGFGGFDEGKHPRGPHGKWLRVGARVKVLSGGKPGVLTHTVTKIEGDKVTVKTPDNPSLGGGASKTVKASELAPHSSLGPTQKTAKLASGKTVIVGRHSYGQPDSQHAKHGSLSTAEKKEAWDHVNAHARATAKPSKGPGSQRRYETPATVAEVHGVVNKLKPGDRMSLGKISKVTIAHEAGKYHVKHGGTSLPFKDAKSAAGHALMLHHRALDKAGKVRESSSAPVLGSLLEAAAQRGS